MGPRHSWDLDTPGPIGQALGLTRAEIEARRAAPKR
jgi:hypothetical protein